MIRTFLSLCAFLLVATPMVSAAPVASRLGQDVTAEFDLPEGLEVRIWAESPQLLNPTNIDVDSRGRIWVTEGVNYRRGLNKHHASDGFLDHPAGDRVVILEDTNGDGAADSSKIFAQDKDLTSPLGIGVIGNKVYVSSSPTIFVYTDEDGDDKPEKKEVFLSGFGGFDHDHGVHAISFGPDGKLYFAAGNAGPHILRDRDGVMVRTSIDGPGVGVLSDDNHMWVQGSIMRIGADGRGLRVMAHNFRNNFEVGLDAFGNLWENDNDDDGNKGCRMTWVLEGGSYGYTSLDARRGWRADQRVGQPIPTAHWHLDDPGTAPPTEITGAGAPTGLVVYEGKLLPPSFRGMVLNADAGRTVVFGHRLKPDGSAWKNERIDFLKSKSALGDEAKRFRPSDVAVGTDGAVYVADWYDPGVGGHNMQDKQGLGRILRVVPKGYKTAQPRIDVTSPEGAVDALLSPAVNVRALGWTALVAKGAAAWPAVKSRLVDKDARVRARLLWLLPKLGPEGDKALNVALADKDDALRVTAFRVLRSTGVSILPTATKLALDPSAAVRREVAVALRDVPVADALPRLVQLASRYDGKDRMMLEAIGIGAQGKEAELHAALVTKFSGKDPLRWSAKMESLAWRLHADAGVDSWKARLGAPKLTLADKQRALVALAFMRSRDAAGAVLEVAERGAEPLKAYALDLAFDRSGNEWKSFGVYDRLVALQPTKRRDESRLEPFKKTILSGSGRPEDRTKAVETLALDKDGGGFLIGLAAQGKLTGDMKEAAAAAIFRNPDPGVRGLASQYFKRPAFEGVEFPPLGELAKMKGDAKKGSAIFFGTVAACTQCHGYDGKGKNVGPDLSTIAGKMGREAIFDSILNPSAGIAFGYEPWVISTRDQTTYTGFILGDGDNVMLKDIAGENHMIPSRDIVVREKQKTSIMPDNIALGMKPQELVDLVTFLVSGPGGAGFKAAKPAK